MTGPLGFPQSLRNLVFACAFFTFWMPAYAWAQPPDSGAAPENIAADPPAHVSFVDGSAVLERDGQPDAAPANMPLLAGDRIRTQAGRVEILFADGSTLHLDANTTVDFQSDELVRLLDGRIRLAIPGPDRRVSYRIDAPSASAVILQPGEYKLSVLHSTRDGEIELAVLRGAAELVNDDGRTPLRAGERAYARANAAPSYAYAFNSAAWDSFDRWSETRRDQRLGVSAQYLPDEVRPYAASFDQYGSWQYQPTYGYVWYPRVSIDWRPYYRGRWVTLRPYGWTWVGLDPFAWPTHHFGRWGFSAGAWFWIPARTWAPAWVSWAYAPGYVSWCPLGWNNRPVIQINVFNRGYDPWRAWTVIPRRHFGVDYVNVHYVAGDRFDARVWRTFEPRYRAPETSGYAVPRSSAPIRVAGTVPPRRSPSTVYTNLEPGASRVAAGGQRVIVGQPRSSVAPLPAPADRSRDSYAVRRGTPVEPRSTNADDQRRAAGIAGVPSREDRSNDQNLARRSARSADADVSRRSPGGAEADLRRAMPRDDPYVSRRSPAGADAGRTRTPSGLIYGNSAPPPRATGDSAAYRTDNPYGRRPPADGAPRSPQGPEADSSRRSPAGAEAGRPVYGGMALPRGRPDAAGSGSESRPSGGYERHAPGGDRPQGPPPGPPSGGGDRRGQGSDSGQAPPPPPSAGSGGGGGHQRGGGQATGRAVPRGGGR